jgi:large subunit ribosomal protein L17
MRHKVAGRKLGRSSAHRKALYRNLVTDLLNYEKITTTEAKAKEIRSLAERMITLGKEGELHSRRRALSFILDKKVTEKIFNELAPRYAERPGGYTRIIKLGPRLGDGAPMAQIELVK